MPKSSFTNKDLERFDGNSAVFTPKKKVYSVGDVDPVSQKVPDKLLSNKDKIDRWSKLAKPI